MSKLSLLALGILLAAVPSATSNLTPSLLCSEPGREAFQLPGSVDYEATVDPYQLEALRLHPGSVLTLPLAWHGVTHLSYLLTRESTTSEYFHETDRDPQHGFNRRLLSCGPDGELRFFDEATGLFLGAGETASVSTVVECNTSGQLVRVSIQLSCSSGTFDDVFEPELPVPIYPSLLLACPPMTQGSILLQDIYLY